MSDNDTNHFIERETGTVSLGSFETESGEKIAPLSLRYERVGSRENPVVLVCHALTGNHETVGTEQEPGWWNGFIGYDAPIDLHHFQVITFNVVGGCNGSTGPASAGDKGVPYRLSFPAVTIRDIVRSQAEALNQLGIDRLQAVIGGSLGGMQALEWSVLFPERMDQVFVLAATPSLSDYGIAFNRIGLQAIEQDPRWNNGNYEKASDVKGFEIARMVGLVTYRSPSLFTNRFDREEKHEGNEVEQFPLYQVESYLKYQGEKITKRFDPNSYLYLLYAMNGHDIGRDRGGIEQAAASIKADVIGVGFAGDLLYPPEDIQRFIGLVPNGSYHQVDTVFGHDGFLVEFEKWGAVIRQHLLRQQHSVK